MDIWKQPLKRTSRLACLTQGEIASELSGSQKGLFSLLGGLRLPMWALPGQDAFWLRYTKAGGSCKEGTHQASEEVGFLMCLGEE